MDRADDENAARSALHVAGLVLSDEETLRVAQSYRALRDKADALGSVDLRDEVPIGPGQLTGDN